MAIWLPTLDGRRGPQYLRIVEALAEAVADGSLPPGTRLPPHRELAYQLGLSPNTTSRAYAEGVKRALLRGEVGRGTYVRAPDPAPESGRTGSLLRRRDGPIDLSRNLPLPGQAEPAARRALAALAGGGSLSPLLDDQTTPDPGAGTAAALSWLAACGVEARAPEVVITSGAQHGLFCALTSLLRPGDLLLTEALSYAPVRAMASRLGLTVRGVAMDAEGLRPDAVDAACTDAAPRALYLVPTLHAPTTVTLSPERRTAIADIARRRGLLVIEDDVFAPLKPDRPPPIATLAPNRTLYVTSLSKGVAPGLRIGILRAPETLAPALRHGVSLTTWMTPPLTAAVAARLILDGTAARLVKAQQAAAGRRQKVAQSELAGIPFVADPCGLHLWLPLPEGTRADAFRAEAARRGVLLAEAREFAVSAADAPDAVRLCLSHEAQEERVREGVRRLARLWKEGVVGSGVVV